MAKKISLNSAYGAIGNQYFRYYKLANAEAITLSGQVSIRWIEGKMNEYLNKLLQTTEEDYVIASDTDSIYLNLGPLVNKFLGSKSSDKAAIVSLLIQDLRREVGTIYRYVLSKSGDVCLGIRPKNANET